MEKQDKKSQEEMTVELKTEKQKNLKYLADF